jgi:polygalacturonase
MRTLFAICIGLLSCAEAAAQSTSTRFDIATYGAVADAAGTWLSGSIHLKSNVTLLLDQGATILATSDPEAYDEAEPNQWDKLAAYVW